MKTLILLLCCFPACTLAQLRYSSFLSGSGTDVITAIAVDRSGYVYATGYTDSPDLPCAATLTGNGQRGVDAFLAKFDPSSQQWVYCAYFGGSGDDRGQAIALDPNGDIVIGGATTSPDLPLALPVQTALKGNRDGFVAKISASSGRLLFSTYLGGGADDSVAALTVDAAGYIHAAGKTNSSDFPFISGLQNYQGRYDGFFSVLDSRSGQLLYSTFFGGTGDDEVTGIIVDASGNRYLTGNTSSPVIPLANSFQSHLSGPQDMFVLKMTAAGALSYATYFGGSGSEEAAGIAVDSNGTAHVTGTTNSADLPLRNALQPALHGTTDAFIAAFTTQGQLTYAGYLGGYGPDTSTAIAVDASGSVYVVGYTGSSDFPEAAMAAPYKGSYDAFVVKYAADYTKLQVSTTFGGFASDSAFSVVVDRNEIWVGGTSGSVDFPSGSANQYPLIARGGLEGFLAGYEANLHGNLIWQQDGTNVVGVWYMAGADGSTVASMRNLSGPVPGWRLVGIADLNGDGVPDLIWQQDGTNLVGVWYMGDAGGTVLGMKNLSGAVPGWRVVGLADLNGDGVPDLIWEQDATNVVGVWYMGGSDGSVVQSTKNLSGPVSGWRVVGPK